MCAEPEMECLSDFCIITGKIFFSSEISVACFSIYHYVLYSTCFNLLSSFAVTMYCAMNVD